MIGYLRLVRLPNVFTSIADIIAGYYIVSFHALTPAWPPAALIGASAALYLSGMAFNDIADRGEDAQYRPKRPIPSKQVSLTGAIACAVGLMILGIILARAASPASYFYAMALAFFILLYDFLAKHFWFAAPVALGICRFLNVQLGMSAHPYFEDFRNLSFFWQGPWPPAFAVGFYAAGITAFSAQEEEGKKSRAITLGWALCGLGLATAVFIGPSRASGLVLIPLMLILFYFTKRLKELESPGAARNLVRAGVMGICALDAGLILGLGGSSATAQALTCLGLLIPGFALGLALAQKEA